MAHPPAVPARIVMNPLCKRSTSTISLSAGLAGLFALALLWLSGFPRAQAAPAAYQTPVLGFGATNYVVNENAGSANITVEANILPAAGVTVTVSYATANGTAIAGQDYTAVSGVLTYTNSSPSLTQIFTVPIINNSNSDGDRTVILSLSNPVNATTDPGKTVAVLTILDDDPAPTATATGGAPIFADAYEPNNNFSQASDTAANAAKICSLTFYPPGDEDYFRWWGKAGITYIVTTSDLTAGLDTTLDVYSGNQNLIGSNDDQAPGNFASQVTFTANSDGYFYARVRNKAPGDPVNKTYCFQVTQTVSATPTPPPGFPTGADACEYNSTIETACLIVVGETKSLTFVPTLGSAQDTDMFKLWVKPGIFYTCDTEIPAGSPADTNMILLDLNGNGFNPPIGNDDKEIGNLGSKVSWLATYTGWLFIEVGPVNPPPLEEAAQYTYTLSCVQTVNTPTPTATATSAAPPPGHGGGGGGFVPTNTPFPTPSPFPTPTPIDFSQFFTPTPAPPPVIVIQPLPTATPAGNAVPETSINVTVYYDENNNFQPELTEGIVNAAVAIYDNGTGQLIAFGHTNEAGLVQFTGIKSTGAVRVEVPFLNHSQVVAAGNSDILVRVAPQPLPGSIP